jgi:mannose-6-phosphate isomerase-like protein (cupin superfamily)
MGNYTHLNLKEIEDQAPKFDMSPDMEFRSARVPLELENSGMSYLRVAPNFRVPFGHHHNEQEEVYVLLSGTAKLKLDDDVIDLKPLDAVRIHRETMRNIEGGPDGAELIAFGAPNTGPGDGPMTQGWWRDVCVRSASRRA